MTYFHHLRGGGLFGTYPTNASIITKLSPFAQLHIPAHPEGKLESRLEGRQEIFVKLAQKRFGALPPDVLEKIKELSVEQLDMLAERLLEVASLDELRQTVYSLN